MELLTITYRELCQLLLNFAVLLDKSWPKMLDDVQDFIQINRNLNLDFEVVLKTAL